MTVNDLELHGKIVVVTGGSRGIGAAIANLLSKKGALIQIGDIDQKININNGEMSFCHVDISDEDSVRAFYETVIENHSKIDILVNNAGVLDSSSIPDMSTDQWDRVIDVNLRGTFLCSKYFIGSMIKNKTGKIVNISSLAGQVGGIKAGAGYTASKAGIIGLTKSFARYGAPYGINVNCVCPGFIQTEMTKGRDDPDSVPLRRLGNVDDVANAVYFLSSYMSDYITGATLDVNGGLNMR